MKRSWRWIASPTGSSRSRTPSPQGCADGEAPARKWHYILQKGELAKHVGRATAAPYRVTWDTTWVPDQDQPMKVRAKITDDQGVSYLTPPVEGLNFSRRRSVKMYKSSGVPERFWVRNGERKTCRLEVTGNPTRATAARRFLSSWSAQHPDDGEFATVGLNDTELASRFGKKHDYSYDLFTVPLKAVRRGTNTFYIQAPPATHHHPAEVNWPGPVLFLEFGG